MIFGMPIVENTMFTKGTREIPKRRNKSKRIQKKWNKKYGFKHEPIPDPEVYIFDGKIAGHPKTIKKVINSINKKGMKL